jgi:hypothetical protein
MHAFSVALLNSCAAGSWLLLLVERVALLDLSAPTNHCLLFSGSSPVVTRTRNANQNFNNLRGGLHDGRNFDPTMGFVMPRDF